MKPRVEEIAGAIAAAHLDGWLFYDFRLSDPIAYRILGLAEGGLATRRWFCFVPARPASDKQAVLPQTLTSAVEAHRLDAIAPAERRVYRSEREMVAMLGEMLKGCRRIAMDYSPGCAIPYVSRVDGGTLELVRSLGVEVVGAADLIQQFEAVLSAEQLASHWRAATRLRAIVDEAFGAIAGKLREGGTISEYGVQQLVLERIAAHGLRTDEAPIVAVNANAANPHFAPSAERDTPIRKGDLVLIDLFAKEIAPDAVYGDLTWMGYAGERAPEELARIFNIVARARDAAVELIQKRIAGGQRISGAEADRAARAVIEAAGHGEQFVHRTGHSIGREVHGNGANLDSLETRDDRRLIEKTCFSVEPGIYIAGRCGFRSELDMTIECGRAEISGGPPQAELIPILSVYR